MCFESALSLAHLSAPSNSHQAKQLEGRDNAMEIAMERRNICFALT